MFFCSKLSASCFAGNYKMMDIYKNIRCTSLHERKKIKNTGMCRHKRSPSFWKTAVAVEVPRLKYISQSHITVFAVGGTCQKTSAKSLRFYSV